MTCNRFQSEPTHHSSTGEVGGRGLLCVGGAGFTPAGRGREYREPAVSPQGCGTAPAVRQAAASTPAAAAATGRGQ